MMRKGSFGRKVARRSSRSRGIPLKVPRKLPLGIGDYQEIYDLFLKHGLRKGKIIGPLVEIGPFMGDFLKFLQTHPFFAEKLHLSSCGIEAPPLSPMSTKAMMRTWPSKIEDVVKKYPSVRGRFNFVIAKLVLDSYGAHPKRIFHAISLITRRGGKVFLQTQKPEDMPSQERIEKEGFKVIDSKSNRIERIEGNFGSLKAGQYLKFILVLQKVR